MSDQIDAGDNWQGPVMPWPGGPACPQPFDPVRLPGLMSHPPHSDPEMPWVQTPENLMSDYGNFKECPACAAKPGSPELCPECLARRKAFDDSMPTRRRPGLFSSGYAPAVPPTFPTNPFGAYQPPTLEREVAWLRSVVDQQARIIETLVGAAASRLSPPRPPAGPILPGAPDVAPGRPPRSPGAILAGRKDTPSREDLAAVEALRAEIVAKLKPAGEDPRQP